jgi:hypothetical protein
MIGNPANVLDVRLQEHLLTSRRLHHKERVSKTEEGDESSVLQFDSFQFEEIYCFQNFNKVRDPKRNMRYCGEFKV